MPADLWKAFLLFKPMNISIIDTVSFCLFNKLPPCFLNSLILLSTQHLPKNIKIHNTLLLQTQPSFSFMPKSL